MNSFWLPGSSLSLFVARILITAALLDVWHPVSNEPEEGRALIVIKSKSCPSRNRFNLTSRGQIATIFSPNYPFSYPNNVLCRYYFTSPVNTRLKVFCDVALPHQIFKCEKKTGDSLFFSLVGDDFLRHNNFFKLCGRYLLKTYSAANKLVIGIRSGAFNLLSLFYPHKKFWCKIRVIGEGMAEQMESQSQGGQGRILGGAMVQSGQFPWRCLLQVRSMGMVKKTCTCSIISNKWILSAVHCTFMEAVEDVFIFVGETMISGMDGGLPISQMIAHDKYGGTTLNNDDVLLLELQQPLVFGPTISPICLPCKFKGEQFLDDKVSVSGFVEMDGTFSLLHKDLMVQDRMQCRMLLPINNDEICIYEPGKTECVETGETGSYADYLDPETGLYYAAGIYSWARRCTTAMMPSVHQNVARYLDWIEMNTGEKFC